MKLTQKEAAARLHLNVNIISLIENENFAEGPPATFMRGYLRSYARLLNLSENEITLTLKELESAMPSSNVALPIIPITPRKDNERYLHWLTYIILLILGVLVSVWWSSHSRYVSADISPAPSTLASAESTEASPQNLAKPDQPPVNIKTSDTGPTPLSPAVLPLPHALAPPATTLQSTISQKAPEPTIVAAPASPTTKPAKKPAFSHLDMALPEPGVDNEQDDTID